MAPANVALKTTSTSSATHSDRVMKKPLQEKERRNKINRFLDKLKKFVPQDGAKLEQADVLDKVVGLVQNLENDGAATTNVVQYSGGFQVGFMLVESQSLAFAWNIKESAPTLCRDFHEIFQQERCKVYLSSAEPGTSGWAGVDSSPFLAFPAAANSAKFPFRPLNESDSTRTTPSPMAAEFDRRTKKQMLERDRRLRMKKSIEQLRAFLVRHRPIPQEVTTKLEKTDVLKGVLSYLEQTFAFNVADKKGGGIEATPIRVSDAQRGFEDGFKAAKTLAIKFLASVTCDNICLRNFEHWINAARARTALASPPTSAKLQHNVTMGQFASPTTSQQTQKRRASPPSPNHSACSPMSSDTSMSSAESSPTSSVAAAVVVAATTTSIFPLVQQRMLASRSAVDVDDDDDVEVDVVDVSDDVKVDTARRRDVWRPWL